MIEPLFNIPALIIGALAAFAIGAVVNTILPRRIGTFANMLTHSFAFLGSLFFGGAAVLVLVSPSPFEMTLLTDLPFLTVRILIDALAAMVMLVIALLGVLASVYAIGYMKGYSLHGTLRTYGAAYNLFLASMFLVVSANDAIYFLVVWELMSVASLFLILTENWKKKTAHAGLFYFIMMQIGASCLVGGLLGVSYLAGSTDLSVLRALEIKAMTPLWHGLFFLLILGFGIKAGIMPLHSWLPAAHGAAPSHVSALMSGIMIEISLVLLFRFSFEVFPAQGLLYWGMALMILGAISAFWGILRASAEQHVKHMLAYSSIENIGIMTIALGSSIVFMALGAETLSLAMAAGLFFHIANHAVFKSLLFFSVGSIIERTHETDMERMGGLVKTLPVTAGFFFVGALAVSAFPPLGAFASEWLIFRTLISGAVAPVLSVQILMIFSVATLAFVSGMTMLTFVKAFGAIFLARSRKEGTEAPQESPLLMNLPSSLLIVFVILGGVGAVFIVPYIQAVLSSLDGGLFPAMSQYLDQATGTLALRPFVIALPHLGILVVVAAIFALLTALFFRIFARGRTVTRGDVWSCGTPLTSKHEISALAFSRTLLMVMKKFLPSEKHIQIRIHHAPEAPETAVPVIQLVLKDIFASYLYRPITSSFLFASGWSKKVQNGNANAYVLYVLLTLIVLLLVAV